VTPETPRWMGAVWMSAGAIGVVLGVATALFGFSFISSSTAAATESIDLGVEVLATVGDTAAVLDRTFGDVADSLRSVQRTVTDGAVTLTQIAKVTGDLGDLVSSEVPDGIEAVRSTMPGLISTAGLVDGTMRALSFVGVDYDPEVPLDESLARLDEELATIPQQLRSLQPVLEGAADGLSAFGGDILVIGDDLAGIRARLTESESLLDEYTVAADRAEALLETLRGDLARLGRIGQWIVLVLGLAIAATQSLPIVVGWQVWSAGSRPAPATG
jgi:hypothetical protein